ncbi:MAG TPA: pyruvate formate-lyase activating enzyme, partial [Thermoleophilia bacterium]|nr:pyruvate formate-lyase activating enzyme [Thermoleophilia bacterium]
GHGAALSGPVPAGLPVFVTGPHRSLLTQTSLEVCFPAPMGDMMMTGCWGLVKAFRRRFGV